MSIEFSCVKTAPAVAQLVNLFASTRMNQKYFRKEIQKKNVRIYCFETWAASFTSGTER